MKRVAALSLVAASLLAYQIHVQSGWQMKAALEDLNASVFDGTPAQVLWSYDDTTNRWQVYVPNNPYITIPNSIDKLQTIPKERGYWVLSAQYFSFNTDIPRYLSAFNRYVDIPQKLEKSDVAQKSFYIPKNDPIAQKAYYENINFDENASAFHQGNWMLESGYLDVYDYSDKLKDVYEKMATNADGDILLVGMNIKDENVTDTFLQPMITSEHFYNLPFIDMSQKLPYTVYTAQDSGSYTRYKTDHTIEKYTYNKDSGTYQKDTSYNEEFTIEEYGRIKIVHTQPLYSDTKYIQIIDEIGRYDVVQIDNEINSTCPDTTLVGKTWDDILDKNATSQCAQMVYYETNERHAGWRHININGNVLTLKYMPCDSYTECAETSVTITYVLDDQNGSITTQKKKSQIVVWSSEPIVTVEE